MSFAGKYGPWAIVVGAAEGLGEAYSEALAKRKLNLLMVDNQLNAMVELSTRLEKTFGIETVQLHLDLSESGAVEKIIDAAKPIDVGVLIYNAAYSLIKPFIDHSPEELDTFIELNARSQIQLIHAFSKMLMERKRAGGIIMMSSLSGLIGMQLVAPYAATKAFAWNLAEALQHELKPHQIDVMACIAGATATPAYLKTKPQYGLLKPAIMKPEAVAEVTLEKLGKKTLFVPGFSNRINYFILTRLLPRKMASAIANKMMGKMYVQKLK